MSTIYILINKNNKRIGGIYNSEIFLQDKINTLKENLPDIELEVEEKIINTNITKKKFINPSFKNNKIVVSTNTEGEEENEKEKEKISYKINEEIENEIKRIEEFHKIFKEDLKSYDNIKENNLEIPDFFKDKFKVIQNIHNNNIPEKERFSYFVSNIYYK